MDETVLYRLRNLKDHNAISISKPQFKIGRAATNDLAIANNRYVSSSHCTLDFDRGRVFIRDTSSNGTLINRSKKIHKNDTPLELQSSDIIHLVFRKDEPQANVILQLDLSPAPASVGQHTENKLKRKFSESVSSMLSASANDTKENADLSCVMNTSTTKEEVPTKVGDDMEDVLTCVCCQDLMTDPICLEPCLHAFCSGCYSSWEAVQRTCPKCRVKVVGKKKNVIINGILEAYLKAYPHKRPVLQAVSTNNPGPTKKPVPATHVRTHASHMHYDHDEDEDDDDDDDDRDDEDDPEEGIEYGSDDDGEDEDDSDDRFGVLVMTTPVRDVRFVCRQCPAAGYAGTANASVIPTGYQCTPGQSHILCQCCVQPMPDRQDQQGVHQSCEICHQYFCHMYFQQCQRQGCHGCLNQLRNFNFSPRHLTNLMNDNPVETQIVQSYLTAHRLTMRDLLATCCRRLDRKEYKSTSIDRNVPVPSKKVTCYKCGLAIFKELAYQFRVGMKQNEILPVALRNREDCYYGRQCRTQYTKPGHAQKLNHACEQSRF